MLITNNSMTNEFSMAFAFVSSAVILSEGKMVANENELLHNFTGLFITLETTIIMENSSFFSITGNRMLYTDSYIAWIDGGIWNTSSDSQLTLTNNVALSGFSFCFFLMDASL